jgi:hypothetical protein
MEMYKREKQQANALGASTSIAMAASTLIDTKPGDSIIQGK